ncbi:hypothetical protein PFISCL1PPCAC_7185, partial [Pristionchus fissidentatus]
QHANEWKAKYKSLWTQCGVALKGVAELPYRSNAESHEEFMESLPGISKWNANDCDKTQCRSLLEDNKKCWTQLGQHGIERERWRIQGIVGNLALAEIFKNDKFPSVGRLTHSN